jgi:hypothetical protein
MGEKRHACRVFIGGGKGNQKKNKRLVRPRRRREDNIKMDLEEIGCEGVDWFNLVQDRDRWRALVNAVMNLRVPRNAGNFLIR